MAETGQPQIFLSTMSASRTQQRVALVMMAVLLAALAVSAPFAAVQLARIDPFIPGYESILIVNDGITAALLYAQYAILRSRGVLVLATAYLFTALIVIPHMLTFPGLFAPTGLLGAGLSSTAWLYVFWHAVFPMAVIAYASIDAAPHGGDQAAGARKPILASIAVAVALVCLAAWLATAGANYLPALMADATHQLGALFYPSVVIWLCAFVACGMLLWRRRSVLDLWLAVVMCALLCEVTLGVILITARFSVGFYLGRVYSAVAASIVLVLLLFDTTALYAQLARAIATERRERERRLAEMEAMLSHLSRVSDLGHVVTTLIHEVNQPLAAIGNYLSALQRLAAMGDTEKVATTIEKTLGQSERAREIIRRLRDFVAKREIERRSESLAATVEDAVAVAQAATGRTGVEIEIALEPRGVAVVIDRLQIEQVLVNLIRNASEAMAMSARRHLAITSRRIADDKIELRIADTGPGLPNELRERLFQPFTTTKASGMGVGLSICRFIIEAHGERLQVGDNPGGGTTFRFTLPIAPEHTAAANATAMTGAGTPR
ncbi:MAG TPA: MASE4 domain-containing protein [Stellaceae bacterium]|nr:MASE4 domain-containing protein [Stellaceae bacterium]